jgi:hypothetical protein
MYTFNIERYLSHYVQNARRVDVRNFRYTYKDGILNKNKRNLDFDLLFNKEGKLLEVIHLNHRIEKSTIYYNKKNQIIKIVKSKCSNNEYISEIDFNYDEQNRLLYEGEKYNYTDSIFEYTKELHYKYENNTQTVYIYEDEREAKLYSITDLLDESGNLINTKATTEDGEVIYSLKNLYTQKNKNIRTIYFNDDGTADIVDDKQNIEYLFDEKLSKDDRGNWKITEFYKNNILKESTERTITYF